MLHFLVTLQQINGTWCYSTLSSHPVTMLFGKACNFRQTELVPGQKKASKILTCWLDGLSDSDARELLATHPQAYLQVGTDGSRTIITQADFNTLPASNEPAPQPQAS